MPQLQTKFDENQKLEHHNMRAPRARKSAKFQRARAEELVLLVFFERAGGQAPQLWEAWPSARARARAKYKPKLQNNHFFVSKLYK